MSSSRQRKLSACAGSSVLPTHPPSKPSPRDAGLPLQNPAPPAGVFRQRLPAPSSRRLQVPPSPGSGLRLPRSGSSRSPQGTTSS
ncbi:Partitioning Defective 3 [Manis pentadactyla]|nr:Partitioning Defective 3 [Manis pentadactyla]